jgi:type VI secretion system secreted protein Hcp
MRRGLVRALCAVALGAAISNAASAAADFYLRLDGIDGEVTATGNEGALALASWSFGASNPTSVGSSGLSAGRMAAPSAEPTPGSSGSFTVSRAYDKASPKLFMACASGQHIASAQLKRCVGGACRTYELKDVVISSYTISNRGSGGATESLSFNYGKIEFEYKPQSELRESPTSQSSGTTSVPPRKGKPQ